MKLKRFELIEGGQFNEKIGGPLVFDFTKSNMIGVKADEEEGKTTITQMMLLNLAQIGGERLIQDLKNWETGGMKSKWVFEDKKAEYEVTNNNGVLTVRREGEKQPGGAQTLLFQLVGRVGISPMNIKDASIEEIVKWLAGYSTRGAEEFEKAMLKIKNGIKAAKKSRADANKNAKGAKEFLKLEGYIDAKGDLIEKKWLESEKEYKTKVKIEEVSGRLKAAEQASDKYIRAEEKLKGHKNTKIEQEKKVADLEKQLAEAKAALTETTKLITTGEKYLVDNKADKTNYDKVKEEYEGISKKVIAYDKWQEIKKKKVEMDKYEDDSITADGEEKDLIKKQQELQWEVIPDIKGVEIVLEDTHEDEGEMKKAGYYFNGLNSRQLSASQWFGQVIQILKKNKIKFLVVDDVSQFGSKFMETLKGISESGCQVFYTEMARGVEEIIIDYGTKKK